VIGRGQRSLLANAWQGNEMRVGTIVSMAEERRQKLSFLFTYNTDQAWAWPEMDLVQDVLRNEVLIPFHVVLDVAYSKRPPRRPDLTLDDVDGALA
jgi:hypothetical protein